MSKKLFLAVAAMVSFAIPASAALVVSNISSVQNVASDNDFKGDLSTLGLTKQATNYSIGVTGAPVVISVYRVAAESGLTNWVQVGTTNSFAESNDTWDLNDFLISYTQNSDGTLGGTINFLSNSNGLGNGGDALGAGSVAVFLPTNINKNKGYTSDSLLFGFNDQGSSDSDYDDYIIRITSTAAVPEPGTWMMLIVGFGMIGYGMRSRRGIPVVSY